MRTRDEIERKLKSKQKKKKNQEDSGTVNELRKEYLTREIALLQWTLENEDSRRSGMQVK